MNRTGRPPNAEKQKLFSIGKALGKSNRQICKEIGLDEGTASDWMKLPAVRAMIQDLQLQAYLEAQTLLVATQTAAVQTLVLLLKSEDESIRFKAAKELLDQCKTFPQYFIG